MEGIHICGIMKGYTEKPWTNDKTRFNRQIGIVTNVYEDQWGSTQETIEIIDVPYEIHKEIQKLASELVGNRVIVKVGQRAIKGGRDGAFIRHYMFKDEPINKASDLLKSSKDSLKVAS